MHNSRTTANSIAREKANEAGKKYYYGQACGRHGTTKRYTNSGGCIECRKTPNTLARQKAIDEGRKLYICPELICKKHPSSPRNTKEDRCNQCIIEKNAEQRAKQIKNKINTSSHSKTPIAEPKWICGHLI